MTEEQVVLVNENDIETGLIGKMEAHEKALLHRAFSVFVFNSKNELMLQQRALTKYHTPGLWTNTCCSHPRPGENVNDAAYRRLQEEMGFTCELKKVFDFVYRAPFENGLTEHEFDHVFMGNFEGEPEINPEEVNAWKWIDLDELKKDIHANPSDYTVWFKIAFPRVYDYVKKI
jgi:isopentenyl-diphosphate Delta-isomerase